MHPFFWLVSVVLGAKGTQGRPDVLFFWVLAIFVSILVHEMGHALAFRRFGYRPWVTLYGMGGLASADAARIDPRTDIWILLAGPGAGFVLAGLIVVLLKLSGHVVEFFFGWPSIVSWEFDDLGNHRLNNLVNDLLYVNVWWGLVNLLPVFPLDGGRIARNVLDINHPRDSLRTSLWLSVFTAIAIALYGLSRDQLYIALFFGYLAYSSYTMLESNFGRGGGYGGRR